MTKSATEQTNKTRILEAAAAEFAERGFDGARVDVIAKRAGINKALIYYYYKSKEELLVLLFQDTSSDICALLDSPKIKELDFLKPEGATLMINMFLDVLESRQNVIRVVLMEIAKRSPINTHIFTLLQSIMEKMFTLSNSQDFPILENRQTAMITEFFTGIMPILGYVAYHEIWMEQFSMEESALRAQFVESFLGSHFGYTIPGFPHSHCSNT